MSPDKLVRMANQIATFFETSADSDPAIAVATHINDFWAPVMRRQLLAMVEAGGMPFDPLVVAACAHIRKPKGTDGQTVSA